MKRSNQVLMGLFTLVIVSLLFTACPPGGGDGSQDLPVKTIKWQPPTDGKGGAIQFYTNDSANNNYYFTTTFTNGSASPGTFEVIVNKLSGNGSYGYGMIFGIDDSDSESSNDYYCLIITTNGSYQVSKRVSDVWTYLKPTTTGVAWPTTAALSSGFNQNNTLKVVRTGDSPATFDIYFNGTRVDTFEDPNPIISTLSDDTKFGLYVSVGSAAYESFPNTPVDIRYTRGMSTIPSPSINSSVHSVSSPAYSIAE
ncbi:hypothetical protein FACS189450_14200 [Spirochaetia bacterium]|nr:hypothetical protein FACS189450_14200 [Spirochaetia bacterium]